MEWKVTRAAGSDSIRLPFKPGEPSAAAARRAVKALGWAGFRYVTRGDGANAFYIYPRKGMPAIAWGVLVARDNTQER